MKEKASINDSDPREIIECVIEKHIPAVLFYKSNGKRWPLKVLPIGLGADEFLVDICPRKHRKAVDIRINQQIELVLKLGHGKFRFKTEILDLAPSKDTASGGMIILQIPHEIIFNWRRAHFRAEVPKEIHVPVLLWSSDKASEENELTTDQLTSGRLTDLSAGGLQVVVASDQKTIFRRGQLVTVQFTPLPHSMPMMFDTQIKSILPTADDRFICLGMQISCLDNNSEDAESWELKQRLREIVEWYYKMNQSGAGQQDAQKTGSAGK